ncbi:hypothetical protein [Amycolatopsis plumensis]|uniref:hypothetical protein n=1 Tax=Amycolatopsis plumensis TaxID=236508 RepID=UPI00362031CD
MSCRASFHFVHQGPRPGWSGRRPWRRVLPMPVRALDRLVSVAGHGAGRAGSPDAPKLPAAWGTPGFNVTRGH